MIRASLRLALGLGALLCARCGGPDDPAPQQVPAETVRAELLASGTSARLNGISGTGGADIWVVGEAGTILHHDGSGFSQVASGTAAELRGVAARDPADAWAVGVQAALRYDGQAWRPAGYLGADQRTDQTYNAVLALAAADTWVGGNVAGRRSQQRWTSTYQPQWRHEFRALHALTGHLWIAGDKGVLLHAPSQGDQVGPWELVPLPTTAALRGVTGSAASEIWVVADSGEVLRGDGDRWDKALGQQGVALHAVTMAGDEVWAVGEQGAVLRRRQGAWSAVTTPTRATLRGVWADGGKIWAVGDAGTVVRIR